VSNLSVSVGCASGAAFLNRGEPFACGNQQDPGDPAANRSFGQGDVGRMKAYPDKGEQQSVGDIADHCSEQIACDDG